MTYGYARCSTNESKQDINRQIKELKAAGADEVIFEYEHGDARTKKELNLLLELAKVGGYHHHPGGQPTEPQHTAALRAD